MHASALIDDLAGARSYAPDIGEDFGVDPGGVRIADLVVPEENPPDAGDVGLSARVETDFAFVGTNDPDFCDIPLNVGDGIAIEARVSVDGRVVNSRDVCLRAGPAGSTVNIDFPWPEGSGEHTVGFEVFLRRTNRTAAETTRGITTLDTSDEESGVPVGIGGLIEDTISGLIDVAPEQVAGVSTPLLVVVLLLLVAVTQS